MKDETEKIKKTASPYAHKDKGDKKDFKGNDFKGKTPYKGKKEGPVGKPGTDDKTHSQARRQ